MAGWRKGKKGKRKGGEKRGEKFRENMWRPLTML